MLIPFKCKIFLVKYDEKLLPILVTLLASVVSLYFIVYHFFNDNTQLLEFFSYLLIAVIWALCFFILFLYISWADFYKWCCRDFYWTLKEKYPEIMVEIWDELLGVDPNDKELKNGLMGGNPFNEEAKNDS